MLSDNNEKGVFYTLFGIVAVFLAAIALAGFAQNAHFSNGSSVKQEISEQDMELHRQQAVLDMLRSDYESNRNSTTANQQELQGKTVMVNIQCERLAELRDAVATLTRELGEVQARYDKYRQLYRTQSRGEAVGQKLDSLKTRAGRVYDQVTIRQVYCDGMSISYDGGVVRLSVEDLGSSWAERFDWNVDEQLAARKAAELIPISSPGQSSSVQYGGKPNKAQSAPRSFNSPEADAYRNQMADLKNQLLDTRDRLESAVQQQATGKNRSVPGSLETWDSYVERLQRQQSLLRRQYASLRAKLLVLSPREPADKEVE